MSNQQNSSQTVSRRDFLRAAAVAGFGFSAAGLMRMERAMAAPAKTPAWARAAALIRNVDPKTGTVTLPRFGFAIVEGWVRSVGDRDRDLYLNFGRDWSTDFTATLRKRDFSGAAEDLARFAGLTGKRVRVRGVAEPWQGGRIAVTVPGQIEILTPLVP